MAFVLLVGACGTQSASREGLATADAPAAAAPHAQESDAPPRAFPDESLYPLLLAEFALRQHEYDLALEQYMEQSRLLRDSGVSAHTTRLAQYLNRGQEALEASRLWVELEPDNLEARLALANLLAQRGHSLEGLSHMEHILRAGGLANFSALTRGFLNLTPEQGQQLFDGIDSLLGEFPANTQLRISKAIMLETLKQHGPALEELQPVFKTNPNHPQALALEASLRLSLGQTDRAFDRVEQVLEQQPDNSRLRRQYARLLTRVDMVKSRRQFEMLVERDPDEPDLVYSLALVQRETGQLDEARGNFLKLLDMDAHTDEAHYYLGRTADDQGREQDALTHYRQVSPGRHFGNALDRVAQLLLATGRVVELGEYFEQLRGESPRLAEELYDIQAKKLIGQRLHEEALQLLERGMEQFPDNTSLRYSRSLLYEREGNVDLALRDLRHILDGNPDNATALNALGYTLANRTERYAEAETLIIRALELSPDEPAIIDSMGWVKYRLGEYELALDYLQRAYRMLPDPEVAAHLGEVLWMLGRQDAALEVWNEALEQHPGHQVLQETMQGFGVGQP